MLSKKSKKEAKKEKNKEASKPKKEVLPYARRPSPTRSDQSSDGDPDSTPDMKTKDILKEKEIAKKKAIFELRMLMGLDETDSSNESSNEVCLFAEESNTTKEHDISKKVVSFDISGLNMNENKFSKPLRAKRAIGKEKCEQPKKSDQPSSILKNSKNGSEDGRASERAKVLDSHNDNSDTDDISTGCPSDIAPGEIPSDDQNTTPAQNDDNGDLGMEAYPHN